MAMKETLKLTNRRNEYCLFIKQHSDFQRFVDNIAYRRPSVCLWRFFSSLTAPAPCLSTLIKKFKISFSRTSFAPTVSGPQQPHLLIPFLIKGTSNSTTTTNTIYRDPILSSKRFPGFLTASAPSVCTASYNKYSNRRFISDSVFSKHRGNKTWSLYETREIVPLNNLKTEDKYKEEGDKGREPGQVPTIINEIDDKDNDTVQEAIYKGIQTGVYTHTLKFERSKTPFSVLRCMHQHGKLHPSVTFPFTLTHARQLLTTMLNVSVYDAILNDIQRQGRISFYMSTKGEEAASVGSAAASEKDDIILSQYREVGALMWRGFTLDNILNQCFGTNKDICKGRAMPVHYAHRQLGIYTMSSPLCTQLPHACGVGYSFKLRKQLNCAFVYFGEGAASEGDFAVALNLAKTMSSQTVFICRNNAFAISTHVDEQYKGDGIAIRGLAYGIPSIRVDGNDIVAVFLATKEARHICISEQTPVLLELMTYRLSNHSTSDDSTLYRNEDEYKKWNSPINCPITRFEQLLCNLGYWTGVESTEVKTNARNEILSKIKEVEKYKKFQYKEGLFGDVYNKITPNLFEQQNELENFLKTHQHLYDMHTYDT